MELSIVSTLYNSEEFVPELLNKLITCIESMGISRNNYEIILVNDGSPDRSLNIAIEEKMKYRDVNIKIIDLSKNFGHHNAFLAGIEFTKGDYVFLIDSDMEVSPDYLPVFYEEIKNNPDIDVVYGYLEKRSINDYASVLFWWLFRKLSHLNIKLNMTTERIMNRNYVNGLLQIGDYNLFLGGLFEWVGFNQKGILVTRKFNRKVSNYNFSNKLKLFINAITSFTSYPLYLLFNLSIWIITLSLMYILYIVIKKIIYPQTILIGFTSIIASMYLIGGILLFSISLIGLYIDKIFNQVKNRPRFIIKKII